MTFSSAATRKRGGERGTEQRERERETESRRRRRPTPSATAMTVVPLFFRLTSGLWWSAPAGRRSRRVTGRRQGSSSGVITGSGPVMVQLQVWFELI
ncbi:hypothetical protein Hdeb2414_s0007g00244671 [Helianthus debilis subsp. tardiflorus]